MKHLARLILAVAIGAAAGLIIGHAPAWLGWVALAILLIWFVGWLLASGGRIDDNLNNRND